MRQIFTQFDHGVAIICDILYGSTIPIPRRRPLLRVKMALTAGFEGIWCRCYERVRSQQYGRKASSTVLVLQRYDMSNGERSQHVTGECIYGGGYITAIGIPASSDNSSCTFDTE
jgi:hypothetical protein